LNDLEITIRVFLEPVKSNKGREDPLLTGMQISKIFGNIEEIRDVSKKLYEVLLLCRNESQCFGQLFLDNMEDLRKYKKVCTIQQTSEEFLKAAFTKKAKGRHLLQTLGQHTDSDKSGFYQFCEEARSNPECRQLTISAFLIKPFQRITKYPLLLREILNFTDEDHPDRPKLIRAQEEINTIIGSANEQTKKLDGITELLEIQGRLCWMNSSLVINLGDNKQRKFIREGSFKVSHNNEKLAKHYLFFFNDIVVLTKSPKKKKHLFLLALTIVSCVVFDLTDGAIEGGKAIRNAFALVHRTEKQRLAICCKNKEEKQQVVDVIYEQLTLGADRNSLLFHTPAPPLSADQRSVTLPAFGTPSALPSSRHSTFRL